MEEHRCAFCHRTKEEVNGKKMDRLGQPNEYRNHLYENRELPVVYDLDETDIPGPRGLFVSFHTLDVCEECLIRGSGFHKYSKPHSRGTLEEEELAKALNEKRFYIDHNEYYVSELSRMVTEQVKEKNLEEERKRVHEDKLKDWQINHPFAYRVKRFQYGELWGIHVRVD